MSSQDEPKSSFAYSSNFGNDCLKGLCTGVIGCHAKESPSRAVTHSALKGTFDTSVLHYLDSSLWRGAVCPVVDVVSSASQRFFWANPIGNGEVDLGELASLVGGGGNWEGLYPYFLREIGAKLAEHIKGSLLGILTEIRMIPDELVDIIWRGWSIAINHGTEMLGFLSVGHDVSLERRGRRRRREAGGLGSACNFDTRHSGRRSGD